MKTETGKMSEEGNINDNDMKIGEVEGIEGSVNDEEDLGGNDLLRNQDLEKEEHLRNQDSVEEEHRKNQNLGKMEHRKNQTDDEKQGTEEDITEVKICEDSELKSDKSKDITDCDHTPIKDKSHKDNKEDNTESTEGELNETDQDSDEKFLSSVESDKDAEVKFLNSSGTDKESDTVSIGFEIVPTDSLQIPFTHYVDHRNLTHSGKSAHSGERTDHETELVRLLKLYRTSNKDLKDFHRRNPWGTHDTIRGQLWVRVCETLHKAKGNLYDDYEKDLFHQSKFRVPISFLSSIKYYIHLMSFAVFYFGKNLFAREVIGLFSVTLLCKCNITFSLNFTGESGVNLLNPLLNLINVDKVINIYRN